MPTGNPSAYGTHTASTDAVDRKLSLRERYQSVRSATEQLCSGLATEDYVIQSCPEASPTRWHLSHSTWFFETLVLCEALSGYQPLNPLYRELFNSYYNTLGSCYPQPRRGILSRPTVSEVYSYRAHVDLHMQRMFDEIEAGRSLPEMVERIETGLHHEQQHQELILTDIKHAFSCNPLEPAFREEALVTDGEVGRLRWADYSEGLREIGFDGDGFSYDNERPTHRVFVESFELGARLVTNTEYARFIAEGGYRRPEFWLSDGWNCVEQHKWRAPLYWREDGQQWFEFTLKGRQPIIPNAPVCHVSFYEADAYARWAGARLPTEAEWETSARAVDPRGNFLESNQLHPTAAGKLPSDNHPRQLFGDVWEWTASPYVGYPGFRPLDGALGEYNGKFMSNQMVMRGGSVATPQSHFRKTYRNFWAPATRFQFSGIRLAK